MRLSTRGAGNDCRNDRSSSTRGVSCDAPQGAEQEHRRCELRRPARSGARAPEVRVATVGTTGVREGRRPLLCDGSSEPELEHRRCDLRAPNGPRPSTSRHGYGRVDRPETDRDAASVAGSGSSPAQAVLQGTNRTGEVPGGLPLRLYEMVGVRRFRFSYSHSVASPYEG